MAKASYWQRGESLDYTNATDSVIEENTIVDLSTRIGITGTYINPGEKGSLHVCGVYEMPKTDTGAIAMGAAVYFDATGITTSADNGKTSTEKVTYTPAGYAVAAATADDTVVLVKLLG